MALTKVQKTGITDNAIDADKIEDGTIVAADIANGTITNDKLAGSIANDKLANSSITFNGSSVSLGGSVSAGKVQWQSVITADGSTATSAVAGEGYFIDTTSNAHTITLPGSPSIGDTIAIKDYAGTFGTNALTIARNGKNIQGVANNSQLSTVRASVVLVFIDDTKGWLFTNESNVGDLQAALFITATGGTITTSGDFKIHSFTGDGCFVVSQLGNSPTVPTGGPVNVDYLVVAGGGGGGGSNAPYGGGTGGGAGGFREAKSGCAGCYTASPLAASCGITLTAQTYPITVGAGGANGSGSPTNGGNGSDSIFSTITSTGGGGGRFCNQAGIAGGSGSGGGYDLPGGGGTFPGASGGAGNTPPVSPSQGNPGGNGFTIWPTFSTGGGGGGAGASGGTAGPPGTGNNGGNGVTTCISNTPTAYAGGGGGGAAGAPGGSGGTGGGGVGRNGPTAGGDGGANQGGGGGGSGPVPGTQSGGTGGSGIDRKSVV
jgi:hypothetical protein